MRTYLGATLTIYLEFPVIRWSARFWSMFNVQDHSPPPEVTDKALNLIRFHCQICDELSSLNKYTKHCKNKCVKVAQNSFQH